MYCIFLQVQISSGQRLDSFREHKVVIYDNRLQNYVEISLFCVYSSVLQLYQDPSTILQKKNSKENFLLNYHLHLEHLEILNQQKINATKKISF